MLQEKELYIRRLSMARPLPQDSYLNALPAVRQLANKGIDFHRPVTFFVGENGSGKSTLIEAIAVSQGFNPEGGTKNFHFHTADTHSELCSHLRVARSAVYPRDGFFLRAESFYNFASSLDDLGPQVMRFYGDLSLHEQSHGESFLSAVENRFGGKGLYILDEPEAALSPTGLIRLIIHINRLIQDDAQFIIATHSPMLITFPQAEVYQINENGIASVDYHETSHYCTTLRFLQHPESMLKEILE